MKKLFRAYSMYGKDVEGSLLHEMILEDTPENREIFLENIYCDEVYDLERFVQGDIQETHCPIFGGEWDDSTGVDVSVVSLEEIVNELRSKCEREVSRLQKKFAEEEES